MAYAALVSLSQVLDQIMQHDHLFYIPLHHDDEEQRLKSLQEKVGVLLGFLDDRHSHIGGEINQIQYQSLEARIREAAYKAQDVVEYHISDHKNTYMSGRNSCGLWQLCTSFREERTVTVQNEYESELMMALNQIGFVCDEAMKIRGSRTDKITRISRAPSLPSSSNSTSNYGNRMVGFDEDMLKIKEVLSERSSRLKVVSIVGMGGIGKTTLARNIFADSYVAEYFHTCAWVTVSPGYSFRGILLSILHTLTLKTEEIDEFIKRSNSYEASDEGLEECVNKCLRGRTYLVVMDDIWSTEVWDKVRWIFPDDNNGSRVVITTRQINVAEHASSSLIRHLHFLNADQSWSLIKDKVFVGQSCPTELEKIGKKIAENCGGLPLAIVVVAGILTKVERSINQWQDIAENSLAMAAGDEHISKILSLSYDYLSNHLKPCFLYMASFLDATEIRVSKLVMLWVAEGFLKPDGSRTLEEVAEDYLEDLVKRNLVLITKTRSNGKFKSCSVHDLLRDFCIQKAKHEKFLYVRPASAADIADQRRVALDSYNHWNATASPIRSVFYFGSDTNTSWTLECLPSLRLLRVLHVPEVVLYIIPDLFHLRYLAFTYGGEKHLKLHKLQNLETLIIHSTQLGPLKIWKIPKLKHLVLFNARLRLASPPRLVYLSNIQTLTGVVDFHLSREVIDMIPNLKKLKATYTEMSKAKCRKLRLNNLDRLHKLETLDLAFYTQPSTLSMWMTGPRSIPFPWTYTLPPNLKKLTLTGCSPPSEDMSLIGSLHNLEVLKLREFYFPEQEWYPKEEEEFGRLKLLMIDLSNLVCWEADSSNYPCLEHLVIRKCRSLERIPSTIGDIATLRSMEVGPYSKPAVESAMQIREEQEGNGNDSLQVRVYFEEVINSLVGYEETYDTVTQIEKELLELLQIYLDMVVLIEAQGDMVDHIEYQVNRIREYVVEVVDAAERLGSSAKNSRKWVSGKVWLLFSKTFRCFG